MHQQQVDAQVSLRISLLPTPRQPDHNTWERNSRAGPFSFRRANRKRCAALCPLLSVSRTLYPLAVRALWTHLDLTGCSDAYTKLHQLLQTAPEPLLTSPDGPSHGSLVRSYAASGDETTTFINSLLVFLPNILRITFSTTGPVKNVSLALLAARAGRHWRSIDRLSFVTHEDEPTRAESVIQLHNRAVNLVRWGVQGLVLTDSTAKRLSCVAISWAVTARSLTSKA